MSHIFPSLPATLGVYTLTKLLSSHQTTERYLAKQSHVDRSVILEVLRPDMPQPVLEAFLKNARARVAESLPNVSQVLESMATKGMWYTTLECPDGTPLSRLREQGKRLTTKQACLIVELVAKTYDLCAHKDIAAGPLTEDDIYIKKESVTLISPVIAGTHQAGLLPLQQDSVAAALRPVRPMGVPGEHRINTLLDWLEHKYGEDAELTERLDWMSICATASYVRDQIAPLIDKKNISATADSSSGKRTRRAQQEKRRMKEYAVTGGIAAAAVLAFCVAGAVVGTQLPPAQQDAIRNGYVSCATADGAATAIMARPVTIAEYNRFLTAYDSDKEEQRKKTNKGLPPGQLDHTPLDWDGQWEAAVAGKKWHGKRITTDSPVTGVSLWDAMAYANRAGGSLPEQNTLRTARQATDSQECAEWTSSTRGYDAIYSKSHVILPAGDSETPILESDPAARREGRGFRISLPAIPKTTNPGT